MFQKNITLIKTILQFYSVSQITDIKVIDNKIFGRAIWEDIPNNFDYQDFVLQNLLSDKEASDIIEMLDFIYNNNMFDHDKILAEDKIISKYFQTKWDTNRIRNTIENLYNIEIDMIDENGDLNDAFYLHQ
ncbi:hypothetical protein [Bergeyella cardium]|uniref:Uncharacterized protein n=1 Tax=Bergeyella cardium TaxID=1585976 RepID=A0A6P1QV65_9FLAO|nr:hypothetical protein [Bergeyella cardium]QHN65438.1 hypothetical protein DBX24_05850 [Bergeyella cardium]WHE33017.1 hypothetical protein P8603_05880 [Bergeyella cardium]WHF59668.1 hypothetical protein O0R51_05875 [Bergeyella cardium]